MPWFSLPANSKEEKTIRKIALAASAVLFVGNLMPWATLVSIYGFSVSKIGLEGLGFFSTMMGLIGFVIALIKLEIPGERFSLTIAVFGILALAILAFDWTHLINNEDPTITIQTGVGIYVTGLGAILMILSGFSKNATGE